MIVFLINILLFNNSKLLQIIDVTIGVAFTNVNNSQILYPCIGLYESEAILNTSGPFKFGETLNKMRQVKNSFLLLFFSKLLLNNDYYFY